jgi:hypothetical protein
MVNGSRSDGIFSRMRRMPILLCVVTLPAIILVVGCTGGGSQGGQAHPQQSHTATKLELRPEHGSEVSGTATFKDAKDAIVVVLELRNLPKPDTLYLAHIHPGTCTQEQEEEGKSHGGHHEHGEHAEEEEGHGHMEEGQEHSGEIEYPLSQVKSNSKGTASSTTMLRDSSVEELFSGESKHVNVHEAGAGNPPVLTCADLEQSG